MITAEENNLKDITEEKNKYKPPPIPKEVSNYFKNHIFKILIINCYQFIVQLLFLEK